MDMMTYINSTTLCRIFEPLGKPCAVYVTEKLTFAQKTNYFSLLGIWVLLVLWLIFYLISKYDYFVLIYCMKKDGMDIHMNDFIWPNASANIRYIHNVPVRMRRPYLSEGIVDLNMPEFPAIPEDTVEVLTKYLMSLKTDPPALVEEATVAKLPVLAKEPVVIQETVVTDEPGVKDLESESVWRGLLLDFCNGESLCFPAKWVDYLSR